MLEVLGNLVQRSLMFIKHHLKVKLSSDNTCLEEACCKFAARIKRENPGESKAHHQCLQVLCCPIFVTFEAQVQKCHVGQ